jgi:hemolysin III
LTEDLETVIEETVHEIVEHEVDEVEEKPLLRGVSHLVFGGIAVIAWLGLVVFAPTVEARIACAIYMIGICSMLFFSSLLHRGNWTARTGAILLKLDLTGIYLAIAGTYTPLVAIGLSGWVRPVLLTAVWSGAIFGIVAEWLPVRKHKALGHVMFLTLGWGAVAALPLIWIQIGFLGFILVFAGGLLYTVGAVIHITKRPDPFPSVFGYHEVFHALTIAAAICHYLAVAIVVLPNA